MLYTPVQACFSIFGRFPYSRSYGIFFDLNYRVIGNCVGCGVAGPVGFSCRCRCVVNPIGDYALYCIPGGCYSVDPSLVEAAAAFLTGRLLFSPWSQSVKPFPVVNPSVPSIEIVPGSEIYFALLEVCHRMGISVPFEHQGEWDESTRGVVDEDL